MLNNILKTYKERKEKIINDIKDIEKTITDADLKNIFKDKINTLQEDRFIISVFGHYSNGKSTFLNALMGFGDEILVEDELASTAAITKLKYPKDLSMLNKAEVIFSDGQAKLININEIKEYSARNNEFDVENNIVEVILYLDSEILKNGVEIVDTPGFNSAYEIHSEIAERYVNKSDASIFLFSYDQPGSLAEFQFLSKISDKMDRIFLVINKIDKEDPSECTVDDVINDIKKKINQTGVNVDSKIIYKISALMEKQGIKENSIDMRNASLFGKFTDVLINYLTSEENIKDRINSPLKSILANIEHCKADKKTNLECYTIESEKIDDAVEKKKAALEEMEKDLKDKKNHIKKMTKQSISKAKNNIESRIDNTINDIKDQLKEVNSEFALNYMDFDDLTSYYESNIKKCWTDSQTELKNNIDDLIDESIDYADEEKELREKVLKIIDNQLDFKMSDTDKPNIDYNELEKFDREIEKRKKEYDESLERYCNRKKDIKRNESDEDELLRLRSEIERLKQNKENKLEEIGEGNIRRELKREVTYEKRNGFFGKIVNILAGDKKVESQRTVYDDSEVKFKDKRRAEEEKKFNEQIKSTKKKAEEILEQLKSNVIIKEEINELQRESEEKLNKYINANDDLKKLELKKQLINISKNKYIKEIRNQGEEFEERLINHLNSSEKLIIKLISEVLKGDIDRIESMKEEIYTLKSKENMTSDEIDLKIKEISDEIVILNKAGDRINNIRRGEE